MTIIYDKTFRPVYLNMDATILGELDEYRSTSMPRSKHIHEALVLYLEHLKQTEKRKSIWSITRRDQQ